MPPILQFIWGHTIHALDKCSQTIQAFDSVVHVAQMLWCCVCDAFGGSEFSWPIADATKQTEWILNHHCLDIPCFYFLIHQNASESLCSVYVQTY